MYTEYVILRFGSVFPGYESGYKLTGIKNMELFYLLKLNLNSPSAGFLRGINAGSGLFRGPRSLFKN